MSWISYFSLDVYFSSAFVFCFLILACRSLLLFFCYSFGFTFRSYTSTSRGATASWFCTRLTNWLSHSSAILLPSLYLQSTRTKQSPCCDLAYFAFVYQSASALTHAVIQMIFRVQYKCLSWEHQCIKVKEVLLDIRKFHYCYLDCCIHFFNHLITYYLPRVNVFSIDMIVERIYYL